MLSGVSPWPVAVEAKQVLVPEQGHTCRCGVQESSWKLAELLLLLLMGSSEHCGCPG